ncbi:hypothetical protein DFJ74DRAFT_661804 [Hyaloraphidium curvatum]|nr:hypothetical protein DFJ74DRAFT_661804 [Hyaloraphidium curvatum]
MERVAHIVALLLLVIALLLSVADSQLVSNGTGAHLALSAAPTPKPARPAGRVNNTSPANLTANAPTPRGSVYCWKEDGCISTTCRDGGTNCMNHGDCDSRRCANCNSCWEWGCGPLGIYWPCGDNCEKCGGFCDNESYDYCWHTYGCWGWFCWPKANGASCWNSKECRSGMCIGTSGNQGKCGNKRTSRDHCVFANSNYGVCSSRWAAWQLVGRGGRCSSSKQCNFGLSCSRSKCK